MRTRTTRSLFNKLNRVANDLLTTEKARIVARATEAIQQGRVIGTEKTRDEDVIFMMADQPQIPPLFNPTNILVMSRKRRGVPKAPEPLNTTSGDLVYYAFVGFALGFAMGIGPVLGAPKGGRSEGFVELLDQAAAMALVMPVICYLFPRILVVVVAIVKEVLFVVPEFYGDLRKPYVLEVKPKVLLPLTKTPWGGWVFWLKSFFVDYKDAKVWHGGLFADYVGYITSELRCSISLDIAVDPVRSLHTGDIYERANIFKWIDENGKDPKNERQVTRRDFVTCPLAKGCAEGITVLLGATPIPEAWTG